MPCASPPGKGGRTAERRRDPAWRSPLSRAAWGLLASALWIEAGPGPARVAPRPPSPPPQAMILAPGLEAWARLAGGELDRYELRLPAGAYAHLTVEQEGIDVVLEAAAPGEPPFAVDSPNDTLGPEPLHLIGPPSGRVALAVRPNDPAAPAGRYRFRVEALRGATGRDRRRVAAELALARGKRLRQGDAAEIAAALPLHREAVAAFRELGETGRATEALYSLGRTFERQESPLEACEAFREALPLLASPADRALRAKVQASLGKALSSLGRVEEARRWTAKALALQEEIGNRHGVAVARLNLSRNHEALGDLEVAVEHNEAALALFRRLRAQGDVGGALINRARLERRLGRLDEAADSFREGAGILRGAGRLREAAGALAELGGLEAGLGEAAQGRATIREALALSRQLGDRRAEAVAWGTLAGLEHQAGDHAAARRSYETALAAFRALADAPNGAAAVASLGWLALEEGDSAGALAAFEEARAVFAETGNRQGEAEAYHGLAEAHRRRGDLAAALAASDESVARREALRGEPATPDSRISFFALQQKFYENRIALLLELSRRRPRAGFAERALAAGEQARARGLLDRLAEGAEIGRGAPRELLAEQAALEDTLETVERQRAALPPGRGEERRAAELRLRQLLRRAERIEAAIRKARSHSLPAAHALPQPLLPAEIARALGPSTLLLEYALGDEQSYLFALGRGRLTVHPLPPRAVLERAARHTYALVAARQRTLSRPALEKSFAELSRLLLEPVAARLPAATRLVLVGDGALAYVPFAVLPAPRLPAGAAGSGVPLALAYDLVHAPSASSYVTLGRLAGRKGPASLAILADPVFDPADPRVAARAGTRPPPAAERAALSKNGAAFGRLPFSRVEAGWIAPRVAPAHLLLALDFSASRRLATDGTLARYRNLHFATHAVANSDHPELSGLALSLVDAEGRPQDGFLRAYEIAQLDLGAELVVLSACRTALGKEVRGEGLIGLAQSFLAAGARAVLVSLWPVDDQSTARLMDHFYRAYLGEGRPPAAALRAAQAALARDPATADPYLWGGFLLVGGAR